MRIKLPNGKMLVIGLIDTKNIVIGLNSNSFFSSDKRDRHILMLDYDAIPFDELKRDVRRLQRKYDLPTFYIFISSKKNGKIKYHAYCFTPLSFEEMSEIVFDSKADFGFKSCLLKFGFATLRFSPKRKYGRYGIPEFYKKIVNKSKKRKEIKGAFKILMKLFEEERKLWLG